MRIAYIIFLTLLFSAIFLYAFIDGEDRPPPYEKINGAVVTIK